MYHLDDCISCLMERQAKRIALLDAPEKEKKSFSEEVRAFLVASEKELPSPYLLAGINEIYERYFGQDTSYFGVKKLSNDYALGKVSEIERKIFTSDDPFRTALYYTLLGNYIDFGALKGEVDFSKLDALLETGVNFRLSENTVSQLRDELKSAEKIVYITDNAGEIVFDRLFGEYLRRECPNADITFIVRGYPVINDADMSDAEYAGLTEKFKVIAPENRYSGYMIGKAGEMTNAVFDSADVIIAKGQGNFETMSGCGRNVYYIFLCKCVLFLRLFGLNKLEGVIINERELKPNGEKRKK